MPRRIFLPILIAIVCLVTAIPAVAAPLLQDEVRVEIISPGSGTQVRGRVPIVGSVIVPGFQFYKVEWGIGPNPSQWAVIGSLHDQQVTNNQLEVWDTTILPDDVYTLRLTGVKADGNWVEYFVRNLQVANSAPAATATPTETPTPEGTLTATPTPAEQTPAPTSNGTPEAGSEDGTEPVEETTPGVLIIAPTAALMQPTPTPIPDGAEGEGLLPFDTESLKDAFVFGAMAMGAVFALVGIVFGLRRLF